MLYCDKLVCTKTVIPERRLVLAPRRNWSRCFPETKLHKEYKVTEGENQITIYAKSVPARHVPTLQPLGINAAGCYHGMSCKACGFEDNLIKFYNQHIGTTCDGSVLVLKFPMQFDFL